MTVPLNVLMLEASADDAGVMLQELRQSGFDVCWRRVCSQADFLAELKAPPDLILSDFAMPQFTGLKDKDIEQFRQQGKQVIVAPEKYRSGPLRAPFEKTRKS